MIEGQAAELPTPPGDAHEVALEYLKQVIALAAGVLALSATFVEKLGAAGTVAMVVMGFGWLALTAAVYFGLEAISAIVKSRLNPLYKWSDGYGRNAAEASKYCFVVGLALVAVFSMLALSTHGRDGLEIDLKVHVPRHSGAVAPHGAVPSSDSSSGDSQLSIREARKGSAAQHPRAGRPAPGAPDPR